MFTHKRTLIASAITTAIIFTPLSFATPFVSNASPKSKATNNVIDANEIETDFEVIVISASKTEKALKDVAGSISVITEEELASQVVTDMSQLFKYDPSVQVSGSRGGAQNIIVRGMGGDRVLMIKDGMRMNEGYGADGLNDIVGRGFVETDTLKQVEVAKGAASSLYGSDALGGIVVFTTKDASDYLADGESFSGKIKLGYSSEGKQNSIGTTLAVASGKFEHLLNASMRDGDETQNFDETKPELAIESSSVFYKAKYNINPQDYFSFTADLWQQDTDGNIAYGLLTHFRGLDGYDILQESNQSKQDNTSFQLRYHSESSTAFYDLLNVSLYSNKTKQVDIEYGQLDINANYGFPLIEIRDMWKTSLYEQSTQGFLSNASVKLNNNHTLGYGLDLEKSRSKRTEVKLYQVAGTPKAGYPQELEKFPTTDVFRAGFFINDEISLLNDQLIITPGARFDHYKMEPNGSTNNDGKAYREFDENHVSLNLGALYKFSDEIAAFVQYGQGFKVPAYDLAYIDHDNSLYGYKIIPSDDLSPEESDTIELGLRGQIDNFFFSTAIYHTQYNEFLATKLVATETVINRYTQQESQINVFQYHNIDAVTIKGIEIAGRYHFNDSISAFANASYQDGKDDETGNYITSITPLSGTTGVVYEKESFSSQLIVNWAKRMTKVNDNAEVAGYGTIDLMAHYQFNEDLKVNLALSNLTDKKYIRYINAAGHADDSILANMTEAGRSFSATLHYKF